LSDVDPIKVCVAYKYKGKILKEYPLSFSLFEKVTPVYKEFPGFSGDLGDKRKMSQLPLRARQYVDWVERYLDTPISIVSVGRKREATIVRESSSPWLK
jgi:adenylosuccinate synthase